MALSFKVASSSQAKQDGIIQRLTRLPLDYNWATFGPFLLRLCQRVIVEDVLITRSRQIEQWISSLTSYTGLDFLIPSSQILALTLHRSLSGISAIILA